MKRTIYYHYGGPSNSIPLFALEEDTVVTPAGTFLNPMPAEVRGEIYRRLAVKFDFHFIFEDHIPEVDFYAVPMVNLFAADSRGGFWGTVGDLSGIGNLISPICYIDAARRAFFAAENLLALIDTETMTICAHCLRPMNEVTLYPSRQAAEAVLDFVELSPPSA